MILPREHETPFNKAPLIRAIGALLMVITILSAVTRIATRLVTIRTLKGDDYLVAMSTIMVIAQSMAVIAQGSHGLGKIDVLTTNQISFILKGSYAADILFILALLLAKLSATRAIWDMAPRERRRPFFITEGVIGLWALSSILAAAFKCSLPEPWDYINGQCFNQFAFWVYVDGLNIVTDLAITGILFRMFIKLKTSTSKKILVMGVFGSRILIIPPAMCHMYYYKRAADSNNPMFSMWRSTVIIQVIQCMSVMTTCIPYLKPFMDSLDSGQMKASELPGIGGSNSRSRSGGYGTGQASRLRGNAAVGISTVTTIANNASHRRQKYEMIDMDKSRDRGSKKKATSPTTTTACEAGRSWDGQSHTSQTVLVEQTWRVDIERKAITPN
ncbi:hypothetical protein EDB81DRAFT_369402 [Dactylonectria macrodidyma]|uniref:Rhodopsin domain-containing protein n=1 Tax=Dactylonectria macrodidyma TaxID=307937 RepID=A0A9P9I906_9HYPO|nr:hypothetical protein EDB81DRAFT_369402 [Dactylonectria macrodidyma]